MISCDYFVFIITLSSATLCYSFRNSYTAAVVDYLHIYEDNPEDLLKKNVDQYLQFMRNASSQNADIIVFPEYGIVGLDAMYIAEEKNSSELTKYGTYVPDPTQNIAPCDYLKCEMCKEHLVNLSCAARANAIYTVVNLPEMEFNNDTGETDFHNTNVVFDRSGAVIAKFRKINLSQEPFLKAGRKIVTFVTDFNVTFGIFTCFDLLFRYPAMEVLSNPEVTDVIFPTAWYSETPFLQGLSIQHGYAKSKGVNMLASALQEPYYSDGGSAIYLSDGSIAEAFITNKRESRMLVNDVPIIQKRAIGACENLNKGIKKPLQKGEYTDIDNFPLNRDGTKGYIYEPLGKQGKTQTRICTDNEDFCCFFNITVDSSSVTTADYGHRISE
ncbi:vanin-like protein 2 isoform X2 [Photinus pyralis]|uniref:vanin-like protein 2 isoform X2 n=1 Tax=Photinus pyralis TaxID=7054 RepID=UPI001266F49B|nr:vanin-like protein 2 isoform X2 [Photinus pyralis]